MVNDDVCHQLVVFRHVLDILPVAKTVIDFLVVDDCKAVVAAPRKKRQDMHGIDTALQVFIKEASKHM